jgi:hypothetical protein
MFIVEGIIKENCKILASAKKYKMFKKRTKERRGMKKGEKWSKI